MEPIFVILAPRRLNRMCVINTISSLLQLVWRSRSLEAGFDAVKILIVIRQLIMRDTRFLRAFLNGLLMEIQADLLGTSVSRSAILETTGLGAGLLAGLATGFWPSTDAVRERWREDRSFSPQSEAASRDGNRAAWLNMVKRIRSS